MSSVPQGVPIPNGDLYTSVSIVFTVLAGVAVLIRLLTKTVTKAAFGADDWLITVGYVFWLCEQAIGTTGFYTGIKATSFTDPEITTFLRLMYISAVFYFPATTLARIGILFFYRRIFLTKSFRNTSLIIIIVCILHCISCTVAEILMCVPVEKFWHPTIEGKCFNYPDFFIASTSAELGLDTVILILPLRQISKLQMSLWRKIMVSLIFLLGGFAIITGIVRIALTEKGDVHYGFASTLSDEFWMFVHTGTLFICACLPTYRPLFIAAKTWASSITQSKSSGSGSEPAKSNVSGSRTGVGRKEYKEIDENSRDNVALVYVENKSAV